MVELVWDQVFGVVTAILAGPFVSVGQGRLSVVLTAADLVAAVRGARTPPPIASSGFAALDSLTGGFLPGRVWIVVGAPGQGRSTLLTQWASTIAAQQGQSVHLVTPREPPRAIAARLLSMVGRLPLHRVSMSGLRGSDEERLAEASERVERLALFLYARGEDTYVPEVHPTATHPTATALIVDDADLVSGVTPDRVASWAEAGLFVLLSLPRHLVLTGPDAEADLDPTWARAADLILEVRHMGLPQGDQRPGEADFSIHYNRWGYLRTVPVQYQGHFSRFVEATS